MGIMPYTTEKNIIFQVIESYCNDTNHRERVLQVLWDLIAGADIATQTPVMAPSLDPLTPPAVGRTARQERTRYINEDWFGKKERRAGNNFTYGPQPVWNPSAQAGGLPNTGTWNWWYGDCEGILRETLIRALCLSLGLSKTQAEDPAKPDHSPHRGYQLWPISFLWKCPQPWYEGWIEFQRWGANPQDGHVTVVISSPAHGVKLYNTPVRPSGWPPVVLDPFHAYAYNPDDRTEKTGVWVVSQVLNAAWNPADYPSGPTPPTTWGPPVLGAPVRSQGEVVCVSPAVPDGGASPTGIPYP